MKPREIVGRTYAKLFARPGKAQSVNHALYHLALRGMGYNNGWLLEQSGELWFIKNVLAKSDCRVVFDVGANIGSYSRALLQHTNMTVHAFEPLPMAFRVLEYIDSPRFIPHNCALGREQGVLDIHYGDAITEHASLADAVQRIDYVGMGNTKVQPVKVQTLDAFVRLSAVAPDFLKIDVEGWEYDVLAGALDTLHDRPPKYIQIEWNLHQLMTGHTLLDIADLLGSEYIPYQLLPRGMRQVDPKRPEANTFCYGNFVFVHQN